MTVKIKITESVDARDARLAKASRKLAKVCKALVTDAIDHDYLLECGSLYNVYRSEYGYNGVSPKACMDYLQGLPSVCTVPFSNKDILDLLATNGIPCWTADDECDLIDRYWSECGKQFYLMVR